MSNTNTQRKHADANEMKKKNKHQIATRANFDAKVQQRNWFEMKSQLFIEKMWWSTINQPNNKRKFILAKAK